MKEKSKPLCVDLDGTLLDSDMLVETGFSFIKNNPLGIAPVIGHLFKGKAHLKAYLVSRLGNSFIYH
ncbi:hypothetical protein SAMN04487962_1112 [Marinobacter segnicrescens]|uniref:Haloacid dehalogenase-like hydrolase n=1 Tax=Marinobacter segnicrescens TaxID=430453 RepID=A0A1I0EXC8_9GAMM|nr:hypothetical protein SAMN04487962_1112 [Marinobacter segnicrescens]